MAGFQSCPNIIQTVIWALAGGEECLTIWHFTGEVPVTDLAQVHQVAGLVHKNWRDEFVPQLPATYEASKVQATLLTLPNDLMWEEPFIGTTGRGNNGAPQAPNNVSLAVQHSTGLSGRSARGRTFWPLFTKDEISGNTVLLARVTLMLAAFETMRADLLLSGWHHVVLSRWAAKVKRPTGVSFDIKGYTVKDNIIDSMRRRLPGRGA